MSEGSNQQARRLFLLKYLLGERPDGQSIPIPAGEQEQKRLLRALFNLRAPGPAGEEFLAVQDEYLGRELRQKGITDLASLAPAQEGLYLWRGDITTLRCDAIVNAANSGMTGCYVPCHGCIDNCIHTYAGVQLRWACAEMMRRQGHEEETGRAKITPAFNLPCRYILHTVGPIVRGPLRRRDEELLAGCYRSCLELAGQHGLNSVAFCCISTGEFHFPAPRAAEIAVRTVKQYKSEQNSRIQVIFNVFKESDDQIYQALLAAD